MLSRKLTLLICSELPYFLKQVHIFPRGGVELEDNSFNPEQISRMMNMIKMVQMLNNENKSNEDDIKTVNDKNDTVVEELNENINQVNDGVKTIEKAIPYIDPKYQKNLEIMVKIMELQKVINSFSAITIQSKNPEEKSRKMHYILAI